MTRWARLVVAVALGAAASPAAETLQAVLTRYGVPVDAFSAVERRQEPVGFAVAAQDGLFLMAYYHEDGSGFIRRPLRLLRHSFGTGVTKRAEIAGAKTLFMGDTPSVCIGSATSVQEQSGHVYINIHKNPSNSCTLVLSDDLVLEEAISGWLLGVIGGEYAIVQDSVVHFAPFHPLRMTVYDARRKLLAPVYPPANDSFRRAFADSIRPHMNEEWCRTHNSPCDPSEFDGYMVGELSVNAQARVFGFVARMQWRVFEVTFDDKAPPRDVVYVYRARAGKWEHRAFESAALLSRFGVATVDELVKQKPDAAFSAPEGHGR